MGPGEGQGVVAAHAAEAGVALGSGESHGAEAAHAAEAGMARESPSGLGVASQARPSCRSKTLVVSTALKYYRGVEFLGISQQGLLLDVSLAAQLWGTWGRAALAVVGDARVLHQSACCMLSAAGCLPLFYPADPQLHSRRGRPPPGGRHPAQRGGCAPLCGRHLHQARGRCCLPCSYLPFRAGHKL